MSPTRGKGPRDLWRSSLKEHIMGAFQIARDALTPAACQKLYPWVLWKGPVLLVSKTSQCSNWERRILLCWGRFREIKKKRKGNAVHSLSLPPSALLYQTKDFHWKVQTAPRSSEAINQEILKSHLFRNHMRKVSGSDSSKSEFSTLMQPVGRKMVGYKWHTFLTHTHTHMQTTPLWCCAQVCLYLYSHHCHLNNFPPNFLSLVFADFSSLSTVFNISGLSECSLSLSPSSLQLALQSVLASTESSWILHSLLPLWFLAFLLLLTLHTPSSAVTAASHP